MDERQTDFALVTDGAEGQTEEEKREAYAAEETAGAGKPGEEPKDAGKPAETAPTDKPAQDNPYSEAAGGKGGSAEKDKPLTGGKLEDAAAAAFIALGEKKGSEKARAELEKLLKDSGTINPETKKPFASLEEFRKFGAKAEESRQMEEAKATRRRDQPVEERLREIQERDRLMKKGREADAKEALERSAEESQKNRRAWLRADAADFRKQFPEIKIEDVEKNEDFREFADDRYGDGKHSLASLWRSYEKLTGRVQQSAAAGQESKASRSTGSGSEGAAGSVLTGEQRKALEEWNRAYPGMRMTEKEFATRG